jgi:hypothetical protein
MRTLILIICAVIFGLFVYWRLSIVTKLVVPQSQDVIEKTENEARMQSDKYSETLKDVRKKTGDLYDTVQ